MTIKPVTTSTPKRVPADAEQEAQGASEQTSSHSQQNVVRSTARNVVIDSHGQSPRREVFDELTRHRCSPHKANRSKRREHHDLPPLKRDRGEREKLANVTNTVTNKCSSPLLHNVATSNVTGSGRNSPAASNVSGGKSPEHLPGLSTGQTASQASQVNTNLLAAIEETYSGYNSGDEHLQPKGETITVDEWQRRDEKFAQCMTDRGYVLKAVEEDGACLFRSISLQIYGDEGMHDVIRQHTMDYIYKNREYFRNFVTEDINSYIKRKRKIGSHGNHIEIQAISEIYNRPVEVYCYKPTPINIFNSVQIANGFAPLRLSYQRGSHYNAIIDPYNATVGVGLGLAGYKPDLQTKEAQLLSEQMEIEQTMFEDKLKTTDWEATNEAMEEEIARESYLQWCRENIQKSRTAATSTVASTTSTITSAEAGSSTEASPSKYIDSSNSPTTSALAGNLASVVMANNSTCGRPTCSSLSKIEQAFAMSHSTFAQNRKTDDNDVGFESDDTDMSSTSSVGTTSPSSLSRVHKKKIIRRKTGRLATKRRRESSPAVHENSDPVSPSSEIESLRSALDDTAVREREATPDAEQLPCTSKNSIRMQTSSTAAAGKPGPSTFYQELLKASYASDGVNRLSESEMLQRAIRMSTEDYIEDQKRKYLCHP